MTDTCLTCGETKPVTEFCKTKQAKRGYILKCKACERLRTRNKRRGTYETARQAQLRNRFGITLEVYQALDQAQNSTCRICRTRPPDRALAVDHCHTSGIIRGLLCHSCNVAIGLLKDDPALLREAADYLARSRTRAEEVP